MRGATLALVPDSKLDHLAQEAPTECKLANACGEGRRKYEHPIIFVHYDQAAFEYIIGRLNQLRVTVASP